MGRLLARWPAVVVFLGVSVGIGAAVISPVLLGYLLVLMLVVAVVLAVPQLGIVLAALSGRFDRVPIIQDVNGPLYVAPFILVLTLLSIWLRGRQIPPSHTFLRALVIIMGALLFGLGYSSAGQYGTEKVIEFAAYTVPLALLGLWVTATEEGYWRLLLMFAASTFGLGSLGLVLGFLEGNLGGNRLAVLGGGPNVFGRFMVYGALCTLPLMWHGGKWRIWLGTGALVVFGAATYLTGSRQAILGLVLTVLFYGSLLLIKATSRQRMVALLSVLLLTVVSALPITTQLGNVSGTIAAQRLSLMVSEDKGDSLNARMAMAVASFDMFRARPFVGWGTGAYAVEVVGLDQRSYPHNIFLELAAELGLLGLFALGIPLYLVGRSLPGLLSAAKTGSKGVALTASVVSCFVFSLMTAQVSGDLYDNRWVFLFAGLVWALPNRLKERVFSTECVTEPNLKPELVGLLQR